MDTAMIQIPTELLGELLSLRREKSEALASVIDRLVRAYSPAPSPVASSGPIHYSIRGTARSAGDASEAMISILGELGRDDPRFFEVLSSKVRGRTRHHLARAKADVYPRRPDLQRYVKPLGDGWFIGVNIANREKVKILREACKLAGLNYGSDLQIRMES
jgi:hypothetical protein